MARTHWIAVGACSGLLALIVAACGGDEAGEDTPTPDAGTQPDTSTPPPVVEDSGGPQEDAGTDAKPDAPIGDGGGNLSDTELDFGRVNCDTTAAPKSFFVNNPSTSPLTYSLALGKGANSPFTIAPASGTIPAGQKAEITVTPKKIPVGATVAAPTSTIVDAFGDTITAAIGSAVETVTLHQTAQGAVITMLPTALDFASSPILAPKTFKDVSVSNTGNVVAAVTMAVTGTSYSLETLPNLDVANGNSAIATVGFDPGTVATFNGSLTATVDPAIPMCAPAPAAVPITGKGVDGVVGVSRTSIDFGTTNCGNQAGAQTVQITNAGANAFTVNTLAFDKGSGGPFTVAINPTNGVVNAQGTLTMTITPKIISNTAGSIEANFYGDVLKFKTTAGGGTDHAITLLQSARGAIVTRTPSPLAFGTVGRGNTSTLPITYRNDGNVAIGLSVAQATQPTIFDRQAADATINLAANGGTSPVDITFTPPVTNGAVPNDTINISRVDANVPLCIALPATTLTGTSGAPSVTASPTSQALGNVSCGTGGGDKQIVFTNNGAAGTFTAAIRTNTQYFSVTPASGNIAAGASVTITVAGKPMTNLTGMGTISDTIDFAVNGDVFGVPTPRTTTASVSMQPQGAFVQWQNSGDGNISSVTFSNTKVNLTSSVNVKLKNSGNVNTTFGLAAVAAPFSANPPAPIELVPNGQWSPIAVSFSPTVVANNQTTTITTTSTAPICNQQALLTLNGNGIP